jgi:TetR/AcrR family transcriptional regulator
MPRGRAPTYDAQREAILAGAAKLFAERGYSDVSMAEVARACGVSKPLLYHYVQDKDDLLVLICEGHVSRLVELVRETIAEESDPEVRLKLMIRRFVEAYAEARHEHRVLTQDVKFLAGAGKARVLSREREVVAAFADTIALLRPEAGAENLHKPLTMLLFGMINWMFTWLKPDGELTYEAMAPVVTELFFGGIAAVRSPVTAKKIRRRPTQKETLA